MSPILPENRRRYPTNWKAISLRIRFERAGGRCECLGECGKSHTEEAGSQRCDEVHGRKGLRIRGLVVLTVAHLDQIPEHCSDENLRAMCQRCHLCYDRDQHTESARRRRKAAAQ